MIFVTLIATINRIVEVLASHAPQCTGAFYGAFTDRDAEMTLRLL